jgi:hypothetical protein
MPPLLHSYDGPSYLACPAVATDDRGAPTDLVFNFIGRSRGFNKSIVYCQCIQTLPSLVGISASKAILTVQNRLRCPWRVWTPGQGAHRPQASDFIRTPDSPRRSTSQPSPREDRIRREELFRYSRFASASISLVGMRSDERARNS